VNNSRSRVALVPINTTVTVHTNQMIELQVTQEYTGHSTHLCYLVPEWKSILGFRTHTGKASTVADIVTTAVRTGGPGYQGISLLVVEKGTPGFAVSRQLDKMGWHASDTHELVFDGCRIPEDHLLGVRVSQRAQ